MAVMAFAGVSVAQTFTVGNLKYRIKDDPEGNTYAYVYDFKSSGMPSKLTIPATVWHNGVIYPVYAIDDNDPGAIGENGTNALWNVTCDTLDLGDGINMVGRGACVSSHLKHVIFGTHLWYIGWSAFSGHCVNVSGPMVFPNTLQIIDHWAFYKYGKNGNITGNLVLPASLFSLGAHAFEEARIPGRLIFAGDQLAYINVGTFKNCTFTGALELPERVAKIEREAFYANGFHSISTGNRLSVIEEDAFAFNSVATDLTLGSSVSTIGDRAFQYMYSLANVICRAETPPTLGENVFQGVSGATLTVPQGCYNAYYNSDWRNYFPVIMEEGSDLVVFEDGWLRYCINPDNTSVTILGARDGMTLMPAQPFGGTVTFNGHSYAVTKIGNYAFYQNSDLEDVVIQEPVEEIGALAFCACPNLQGIHMANSVRIVGDKAFAYNTHLVPSDCQISNGIESIEFGAFGLCNLGSSMTFGPSLRYIGNEAFWGSSMSGPLNLPNSLEYIGDKAFLLGTNNLTGTLTIPSSVWHIGEQAFMGCSGFTGTLNLPSGLLYLGEGAFQNCSGFTGELHTPIAIVDIPKSAFSGCTGLTGWTDGGRTEAIGEYAFSGCTGLTGTLYTYNSTTTIGRGAFYNCTGITGIIIGSSVDSIAESAFSGCTGATSVESMPLQVPTVASNAFDGVPCVRLDVRCGMEAAYNASTWHSHFTQINEVCPSFDYEGLHYEIISDDGLRLVGGAGSSEYNGPMILPETIEHSGTTFVIKEIVNRAFYHDHPHGKVVIPSSVERIGTMAFWHCGQLGDTLVLGESIARIGESAFEGSGINTVVIKRSDAVPTVDYDAFNYNSTAVVPCGTLDMYMNALDEWTRYFDETLEDCGEPGVITEVFIEGFTAPVWGEHPDYNISVDPSAPYTIAEVQWRWQDANYQEGILSAEDYFDNENVYYYMSVRLSPKEGYSFPHEFNQVTAYYNGSTTAFDFGRPVGLGDDDYWFFTINYSLTNPSSPVIYDVYIEGYTAPVWGEHPDFDVEVPSAANYSITSVTWFFEGSEDFNLTSNDIFNRSDGDYYMGIMLSPATGYSFADNVTVYFNGDASINDAPNNTIYSSGSLKVYTINYHLTNEPQTYTITVNVNNSAWGSATGGGSYQSGDNCTLEATPNSGYQFQSWKKDGTVVTTERILNFVVTEDATYTAYFGEIPINYYTITTEVTPVGAGTVTGGGSNIQEGSEITLTAVANPGYTFFHWQDGNTDNPRTITVTADATYTATFTQNQYTIQVVASPASGGTVGGGGTFHYGEQATLTATPNANYTFVGWDDGNTANPRVVTVTGNATYTAIFSEAGAVYYTVTAEAQPVEGGTVTGGGIYAEGTQVMLSATANQGYSFSQWDDGITANPRSITVTSNLSFKAIFKHESYTIAVNANPSNGGTVSGGGSYYYGEVVTLRATAYSGYEFVGWSDGSNENPHEITVTDNATYTATFSEIGTTYYTVSTYVSPANAGAVQGAGAYPAGTSIELKAEANEGYTFDHWNDGSTANPRRVTVNNNMSFTAYFSTNKYTITVNASPSEGGRVTGGGMYAYGETATLQAAANFGYTFQQWSDGNRRNPRSVIVTGDATYTALFLSEGGTTYTLTVTSAQPALGSVSGSGTYAAGSPVEIRAYPNANAQFVKWDDGNTDNPRTVIVNSDLSFAAEFAELQSYTIEVVSANPEMGAAYGGGTFTSGTRIDITAVAFQGYYFTSWQDGNTDNPRTVTVTGNATYTAMFKENSVVTHTVTLICNTEEGSVMGGGVYVHGSQATIQAIPNQGYTFSKWSDDSTENPRTITVNSDMTLVAFFGTGVDENELANVKVYPNPAKWTIRIAGIEANSEAKIYNSLGALVKVVNVSADDEISIRDLSSGLYLIRCGNITLRFVKQQ